MARGTSKTGKTRVRLCDVAAKAELSIAAISMALSNHPHISSVTKRRVRRICRDMGYRSPRRRQAAAAAAGAGGGRMGFVVIGSTLEEPAYAAILQGVVTGTQEAGWRLELGAVPSCEPLDSIAPILELAKHVEALALVGYVSPELLQRLAAAEIPVVVIGHVFSRPGDCPLPLVHVVAPDDGEMGRLATGSLLRAGHRRVAFLCEILPPGLSHSRWLGGYRQAHQELNVSLDPALVQVSGVVGSGGQAAARALAALAQPPSAVVAPDAPIVASFLDHFAAAGGALSRQAVVIGSQPERAKQYGLADVPMVYCEPARLVEATLDLLLRKVGGQAVAATSTILLPQHANLDQISPAVSTVSAVHR